jgi:hypothetical protein
MNEIELTDTEVEQYVKRRSLQIKKDNEEWEKEKKVLLKRSNLRKEYDRLYGEEGTAIGFNEYCKKNGLIEDLGKELIRND